MPAMQTYNACIADMKKPLYLGEFEYSVLLAVLQLDDGAYAVPIRELIESRTGRAVARGALYTALERLESQRLPAARRMRDATDAPRRTARRYFTVYRRAASLRCARRTRRCGTWPTGLEAMLEHR